MSIFSQAYNWFGQTLRLTDGPFWQWAFGGESYSGKCVNQHTAMQLSTVFACVRIIAQSVATLPLDMYTKDKSGKRVYNSKHRLHSILHDSPNADQTAVEFWEAVVAIMLLWGNTHIKKLKSAGYVIGLEILQPDLVTTEVTRTGALKFTYNDPLNGRIEYTEADVWVVKGFGLGGKLGTSILKHARNSLGSAMAADESSGRMFANGMRAGGALSVNQVLKPEERTQIRTSIADQVGGVARTGGLIVLEGGMTYTPLSIPPEDAQMLETRAFNVEEICRWFGVPPSMVAHTEKSTTWGTGLEQIKLGFLQFTLTTYLKRIEQSIKKNLMDPVDRLTSFPEFNLEGFMRADSAGRAALYSSASQNGWMTRNEIRELENMEPVAGGDIVTVQSALTPLDGLGNQNTSAAARDAVKSWLGIATPEIPNDKGPADAQ